MRYYIDWSYAFSCVEPDHRDWDELIWSIKYSVVRYGGALCEFYITDEYVQYGKIGGQLELDEQDVTRVVDRFELHEVAMLGWEGDDLSYLDFRGGSYDRSIGGRRGFVVIYVKAIHQIYFPRIRRWF